ncbi:MAG: hypothetical protein SFU87_15590, partial [Chitinophagaceae bacterium]|nr:hypothetical protein [Chitinophagaceae bacterium]
MASKKYAILTGFIALMCTSVLLQAQQAGSYDWRDSSLIPAGRMPQHSEFMNNQYYYPAKPRNQWELGVKVGTFNVIGDVPSVFPALGFGAHVRKSLGYLFSLRLEYMHGTGKGLHWSNATNYRNNPAWTTNGYVPTITDPQGNQNPPGDRVYYNYKTSANDLGLQGVFSLNNIRFHKSKVGVNFYALAGIGITWYETNINALNGSTKYNFNSIPTGTYPNRKDTKKAIKDLLDDSYETPAESYGNLRMKLFGNTARPSATAGVGVAFKLSKRINLAIEDRMTFIQDDLIDGQRWSEQVAGSPVLTRNFDSYNYFTVGLNFNLGAKSVEPLWWINPLDFAYSEL